LRYYRTTGLTLTQMQELICRVNEALDEPWNKCTGRPKSLGLYKAVEAACMYLRQNGTQEFIGETRDTSQPTISRYVAVLVPIVKAVLAEFVPDVKEAIEIVKGRVVLVDGTLTPCWSYEKHPELWNGKHKTTGFNAQLISLLDGNAVWISDPRTPPGLLTWSEIWCDVDNSKRFRLSCSRHVSQGHRVKDVAALHNFLAFIFTAPGVTTWRDMAGNTRKNQVTRLVTLRHRSTMSGARVS